MARMALIFFTGVLPLRIRERINVHILATA